ncbi:hypothetical protein PROFUN_00353 [Planoprotostelium fungivorum]|uniref:Homeobox domain-containing protein n=1 Tax=Planoprotostelium fungivorum TaxID=1890364 RepID=A0A2P6NY62_9EUKA|nr:hypothetical protein PROFUN_00353 [Planoprotostelium fungivorum]
MCTNYSHVVNCQGHGVSVRDISWGLLRPCGRYYVRLLRFTWMNVSSLVNPRDSAEEEAIDRLRMSLYRLTPPKIQPPTEHSRSRKAFLTKETEELSHIFQRTPYPNEEERLKLSKRYHVDHTQITIWFQNRRSRLKRTVEGFDVTLSKKKSGLHKQLSSFIACLAGIESVLRTVAEILSIKGSE